MRGRVIEPCSPAVDAKLTTDPRPRSTIPGRTVRHATNAARFRSALAAHASSSTSSYGSAPTGRAATMPSTGPSSRSTRDGEGVGERPGRRDVGRGAEGGPPSVAARSRDSSTRSVTLSWRRRRRAPGDRSSDPLVAPVEDERRARQGAPPGGARKASLPGSTASACIRCPFPAEAPSQPLAQTSRYAFWSYGCSSATSSTTSTPSPGASGSDEMAGLAIDRRAPRHEVERPGSLNGSKCSWIRKFGTQAASCRHRAVATGPPLWCGAIHAPAARASCATPYVAPSRRATSAPAARSRRRPPSQA